MTFVPTTIHTEISVAAVAEASPPDSNGLVSLRLLDGSTRFTRAQDWDRAIQAAERRLLTAQRGTYMLFHSDGDGDVEPCHQENVIGWSLEPGLPPTPIVHGGISHRGTSIQFPDGTIKEVNGLSFYTIGEWEDSWNAIPRGGSS